MSTLRPLFLIVNTQRSRVRHTDHCPGADWVAFGADRVGCVAVIVALITNLEGSRPGRTWEPTDSRGRSWLVRD